VNGDGAASLTPGDILIYFSMASWEIQMRMRRSEVNNLDVRNKGIGISLQYKQSYFVDWPILDQHKATIIDKWDYLIDTHKAGQPKMIKGADLLKGLALASK